MPRDVRNDELLLSNSWMVFSRALFSSSILRIFASRASPCLLSSSLSCAAWWKTHSSDTKCCRALQEQMWPRSASVDSAWNMMVHSETSYLCDVVSLGFLLFPLRSCHRKHQDLKAFLHRVDLGQFLVQFSTETESIAEINESIPVKLP